MGLSKSAQNHHCWSETWCDKHIWSHNGNIWQKLDFSLRLQKRCRDWGHQGLHHHPQWTLCYSMSILDQLNGALPGILVPRLQSCTSFPQITRWGIHQVEISEWEYDTCSPQDRLKSERKRVHACTIKSLRFVSSEFHCRKIEIIPWKVRTNDFIKVSMHQNNERVSFSIYRRVNKFKHFYMVWCFYFKHTDIFLKLTGKDGK